MVEAVPGTSLGLRLCLDLNVFVADFIAESKGYTHTLAQRLVGACRRGHLGDHDVQIVVSLPMLNRFATVLTRDFKVALPDAEALAEVIAQFARAQHGRTTPAGGGPLLVLGGTGVMAMRDEEDRYVLETAIAGQADYLITENMSDFVPPATWVIKHEVAKYGDV